MASVPAGSSTRFLGKRRSKSYKWRSKHRMMHAETLAYLFHNLPYDQKLGQPSGARHAANSTPATMIEIPSGMATLGQKAGEFGWDNEFDEHQVEVPRFSILKNKVTNGDLSGFRAGRRRTTTFLDPTQRRIAL